MNKEDFEKNEKEKTLFTSENFLPNLMVQVGLASSKGAIRRNQPKLVKTLEPLDYVEIKWGKKYLFIIVGFYTKEERDEYLII